MPIQIIKPAMWDDILAIQAEAYFDVAPESIAVLQSKWRQSPECCFVYTEQDKVMGYLLAHTWHSDVPPKLYQPLPEDSHGSILFLHDLALSHSLVGKGVGSKMVEHLLDNITVLGCQKALLVSVQDSVSFWKKHGFVEATNQQANESYGEDAKVMIREV